MSVSELEEHLRDAAFFLSVGDQAPFKGVRDVYELTAYERHAWIKKLSNLYQQQKEDVEKARRKK